MPFALLIIGIVLIVAGVRNSQDQLFSLVKGDFSGDANFFYWFISIMIIGAVGYIPRLKPISNAFLVLVILVLFLKRGDPKTNVGGGFFQQFTAALNATTAANNTTQTASTNEQSFPVPPDLQSQLSQNLATTNNRLMQELNTL